MNNLHRWEVGSMNILAVIPARSGSKSVPHKNIRDICGKPMIAYSIEHALKSKYINRVIVSTDSEEYAEISKKYGAEIPFIRPDEYATDTALDLDVFKHALTFLKEQEGYEADIVVQLRPTYPIRRIEDIDKMIEICMSDDSIDSVRSMSKATEVPYKMWLEDERQRDDTEVEDSACSESEKKGICDFIKVKPLIESIPECYNMPRQQLPVVYYQNACIDVFRPRVVLDMDSMSGNVIVGYKMEENFDIDTEEEFVKAKTFLEKE